MKVKFASRLEAIEWIANYVEDEGQFEVLREQLNFNHIYNGYFFLQLEDSIAEVVMLDNKKKAS